MFVALKISPIPLFYGGREFHYTVAIGTRNRHLRFRNDPLNHSDVAFVINWVPIKSNNRLVGVFFSLHGFVCCYRPVGTRAV